MGNKTIEEIKDKIAIDKGFENWVGVENHEFISIQDKLNTIQSILDLVIVEYASQFSQKATKWDNLDHELYLIYGESNEEDEEGLGLLDVGETAAIAFGYL